MPATVAFVVTEHPTHLDTVRRQGYERIRQMVEGLAGARTRTVHYLEVETLAGNHAVVLSGSKAPWAAHDPADLDRLGDAVAGARCPVLGICAGMQLLGRFAGGALGAMSDRGEGPERGFGPIEVLDDADLLHGLPSPPRVFHDHTDEITRLPEDFHVLARTDACPVQAVAARARGWWGTQFHPESWDAERRDGERVLRNFFALAGS